METITDTLFMVRPAHFGYNVETAENNSFQSNEGTMTVEEIEEAAKDEFDNFVSILRSHRIEVLVYDDTTNPVKTDAIFPNNWITTHSSGVLITYPMFSENRRAERRDDIIEDLKNKFEYHRQYFFEHYESKGKFLEGTGSMILDRENKVAYACLSERTNVEILEKFSVVMSYRKIFFHSVDDKNEPIYHTNVMMTLGVNFCVICLETIHDKTEKEVILNQLKETNKEIIEISMQQMNGFAGNMLQVKNDMGEKFLIMSEQAKRSLESSQIERIEQHCSIIYAPLYTIEKYGGGSARCMLAEVFV